jgi:CubicO group peptidase (beta-lactamase class C family)
VGQIHRPGAYSSYCNGGFILAGHLLEYLTGKDYSTLLRERLIAPLGLGRTVTDCADAILQRTAIGSLPDPKREGRYLPTPKFLLPRSAAPAGATLIGTLADLLEFAALHVGRGTGTNGTRILSEASATAMATRTIGRPAGSGGFGLGWGQSGRPGETRLSHSGGSNGGIAQLVVLPERRIAYAAYANSSSSYGFHGELQQQVMATVLPDPPSPTRPVPAPAAPAGPPDPARFLGVFRRKSQITTITADGGRLTVDVRIVPEEFSGSEIYNLGQKRNFEVVPTGSTQLTSVEPVLLGQKMTFDFLEPDSGGKFVLLYSAGRLSRRSA